MHKSQSLWKIKKRIKHVNTYRKVLLRSSCFLFCEMQESALMLCFQCVCGVMIFFFVDGVDINLKKKRCRNVPRRLMIKSSRNKL